MISKSKRYTDLTKKLCDCLHLIHYYSMRIYEFDTFLQAEGFFKLIHGEYDLDVISIEQFSKGEVFYCFFKNSSQVFDIINTCASIAGYLQRLHRYEYARSQNFLIHHNEIVFANNLMING